MKKLINIIAVTTASILFGYYIFSEYQNQKKIEKGYLETEATIIKCKVAGGTNQFNEITYSYIIKGNPYVGKTTTYRFDKCENCISKKYPLRVSNLDFAISEIDLRTEITNDSFEYVSGIISDTIIKKNDTLIQIKYSYQNQEYLKTFPISKNLVKNQDSIILQIKNERYKSAQIRE